MTEKQFFLAYSEIADNSTRVGPMSSLPLMHPNVKQRIKCINEKNRDLKHTDFEVPVIEDFPVRNYFMFELIFKLLLFFVLFGAHMKGYNIPVFISLLIIYYWYNLFADLNAWYEGRIADLEITAEERKNLTKFEISEESEEELQEEEEEREINVEDQKDQDVSFDEERREGIETDTNKLLTETEDDIKIEEDKIDKSVGIDNERKAKSKQRTYDHNHDDISHLLDKYEKKNEKTEEQSTF